MGTLLNRRRYMGGGSADEIIMTSTSNPEVLAICYAQGWAAHANYMTKSEAEAVTSIGIVFASNTSITHFEELQYFKNMASLPRNVFSGCTNLERVALPPQITVISAGAFYNNQKLAPMEHENIYRIEDWGFYNCRNFTSFDLSKIEFIGSSALFYCTNLTDIVSFASLKSISGNNSLSGTALSGELTFPILEGTTIPTSMLLNCRNVTAVNLPIMQYTNIEAGAFQNSGLKSFVIREGCTTANNHSFTCYQMEYIDLPSTFTTWNGYALYTNTHQKVIVCRASIPPFIDKTTPGVARSFDRIPETCKVYVPSASISAYEAAAGWDRFAGRYLPIEGSWYETHRSLDPNEP